MIRPNLLSLATLSQQILQLLSQNGERGGHYALTVRDIPDIWFRLAKYPAIFRILFWYRFRPKQYQEQDISSA